MTRGAPGSSPPPGGALARGVAKWDLADGRRFAEALLAAGQLPETAREELLAFELRYRLTEEGLVPRRGFTLKALRVGTGRLLAARLPGGRVLRVRLPF